MQLINGNPASIGNSNKTLSKMLNRSGSQLKITLDSSINMMVIESASIEDIMRKFNKFKYEIIS
jgi:hypothetical protein